MSRTSLVGSLLVVAGCGGGLEEGVYVATFHDRVGECPEYRGADVNAGRTLLLSHGDHRSVFLAGDDLVLEGEKHGDALELEHSEDEPFGSDACVAGEWVYRAVLTAELGAASDFAGTVLVSALSTCTTREGETWEYPFEEEWRFEARYVGPRQTYYVGGRGMWDVLDPGYCP